MPCRLERTLTNGVDVSAPHAAFKGEDRQLDAAIAFLKEEIRRKPVPVPPAPKYPNKAFPVVPERKQ